MFKLDLEKAEEPEIKWPTSIGSLKKQENSRKTSTSALLTWIFLMTYNVYHLIVCFMGHLFIFFGEMSIQELC